MNAPAEQVVLDAPATPAQVVAVGLPELRGLLALLAAVAERQLEVQQVAPELDRERPVLEAELPGGPVHRRPGANGACFQIGRAHV